MADMVVYENDSHKDNGKSQMVQSENDVKKLIDAFQNFTDPFLWKRKMFFIASHLEFQLL